MKPRTPIQQEVARLSERLPKLTVSADGTVSAPREPVYTKNELGDRYGMRSASALGKEWYEHSAGWCGYLKGKNAVEIGKLSADGTDADLKALQYRKTPRIGQALCVFDQNGQSTAVSGAGLLLYLIAAVDLFGGLAAVPVGAQQPQPVDQASDQAEHQHHLQVQAGQELLHLVHLE